VPFGVVGAQDNFWQLKGVVMRKSILLFLVSLLIGCFYAIPVLAQGTDLSEIVTLNSVIADFQVNENTGTNGANQSTPSIATDGSGNYIITWRDSRNGDDDIYVQRYSSDGTPVGSNFKVNDDTENAGQRDPSIAADVSGNFIITWRDTRHGDNDIYAQRYSNDGTAMGSNFKVNDDTGSEDQYKPSIATDGSGNFIIAWQDSRVSPRGVYAQRYFSDGSAMSSNFKVNDETSSSGSRVSIAADDIGHRL
jgi:hypothetical protein